MSRILRRPMFRGGRVDSRGTGITSGLAGGGRVGYQPGGIVTLQDILAKTGAPMTGQQILDFAQANQMNLGPNFKINPKSKFIPEKVDVTVGEDIISKPFSEILREKGFQTYEDPTKILGGDDPQGSIGDTPIKDKTPTGDKIGGRQFGGDFGTTEEVKKSLEEKPEDIKITQTGEVTDDGGVNTGVTETEKEDVVVEEQGSGIKEMADKYFELMGGGKAFRRDLEDTGTRLSASLIDAPSVREGLANFLKAEAKAGPSRTEKIESDATKAAINYSTQKEFLERKLDNAKDIAEKQIIAQQLKDLNKRFAPGIIEKNVEFITQLKPGTAKHTAALKQAGYESNIFRAANVAAQDFEGGALSATDIDTLGPIYYGKDWKGIAKPGQSEEDGVYLLEETQEIVTIVDGKPTKRQKINMLQ